MDSSKKIELTERNVLLIFKECLDASKQPINGVDLFVPGAKQKPAVLYIDHKKVIPHCDEIYYMLEAQSPVVPRLKRSRCRSSQEVNDSPTPFSALNYC